MREKIRDVMGMTPEAHSKTVTKLVKTDNGGLNFENYLVFYEGPNGAEYIIKEILIDTVIVTADSTYVRRAE